jgi:6-phosphogluconolactonase
VEADGDAAATALAQLTATAAKDAVAARGAFTLAVAGGSLIKTLAALKELPDVPWDKFHVFWVDERCVPHRCSRLLAPPYPL